MDDFTVATIAIVVAVFAGVYFWKSWKRRSALRAVASKLGFTYIGSAFPSSFAVDASLTGNAWNVMDGEANGIRVISFDSRVGQGKGSWTRTVIAVRAPKAAFGTMLLEPHLVTEEVGEWTLQYEPRHTGWSGLMPVDELEARLASIGR